MNKIQEAFEKRYPLLPHAKSKSDSDRYKYTITQQKFVTFEVGYKAGQSGPSIPVGAFEELLKKALDQYGSYSSVRPKTDEKYFADELAILERAKKGNVTCEWVVYDYCWKTSCGKEHHDHAMWGDYCPYCGKKIVEKRLTNSPE